MPPKTTTPRAELHTHLGASVDPVILWSIAHRQGIKLPTKNFWDFEDMITLSAKEKSKDFSETDAHLYHWTELIQSSPEAIQESVKSVIGGGYRKCNLVLQELRFNPMKRNRSGERDLDHIIMSAIWGIEQALLEYPTVKAGIILMMDRTLSREQNEVIMRKAIKYLGRGVIGLDVAGPQHKSFSIEEHATLFHEAKEAGLGITIHTGEEGSLDEMRYVVREIMPHRIGHGIKCVSDPLFMKEVAEKNIVLEVCPTSNLRNSVVKNITELKRILRTLVKYRIKFTINTDGPEMYQTNIYEEQEFLLKNRILSRQEINQCTRWAFESSFLN